MNNYKPGDKVIMIGGSTKLRGIIGTITKKSQISDRVWVKWHGDKIKEYLSSDNTECDTSKSIIRHLTKLEQALT